jgi:hypothetical protein
MNNLYEAVMIVGRSIEEIDRTGWTCGALGVKNTPRCANALLSVSSERRMPEYIYDAARRAPETAMPLRLAAKALFETAPEEAMKVVRKAWDEDPDGYWEFEKAFNDPLNGDLGYIGDGLAQINDADHIDSGSEVPILTTKTARAWFQRAFDKLAEELPEPIPADPPLYVSDIASSRTPEHV